MKLIQAKATSRTEAKCRMPPHEAEAVTLESVKDYYGKVRARTPGAGAARRCVPARPRARLSACARAGAQHEQGPQDVGMHGGRPPAPQNPRNLQEDPDRGHGEVLRLRRAAAAGHRRYPRRARPPVPALRLRCVAAPPAGADLTAGSRARALSARRSVGARPRQRLWARLLRRSGAGG